MSLQPGDPVSRIGNEPVDGFVVKVNVDLGKDGPGNVLEVQVGEETQKVFEDACRGGNAVEAFDPVYSPGMTDLMIPPEDVELTLSEIEAIPRDGATMPSGTIEDVVDHAN